MWSYDGCEILIESFLRIRDAIKKANEYRTAGVEIEKFNFIYSAVELIRVL